MTAPTPDADEGCFDELCRYRNWRSGSMPTHQRGADCPAPTPDAAPNEYSPEAIAAYPDPTGGDPHPRSTTGAQRAAFDRGMRAGRDAALAEAAEVAESGQIPEANWEKHVPNYGYAYGQGRRHAANAIRRLQEGTDQ